MATTARRPIPTTQANRIDWVLWLLTVSYSWAAIQPPPHELLVVQAEAFELNQMMDKVDRLQTVDERTRGYTAVARRAALFQETVLVSGELERTRCIALRAAERLPEAVVSCTLATQRPLHSLHPWSAWLELARTLSATSDDTSTRLALIRSYESMQAAPAHLRADTARSIALHHAHDGEAKLMSEMIVLAIRDGLSLVDVACDPDWQEVYKEKKTQPSIDQVFHEYSPQGALLTLQRAVPCD
jgi:hypothetical protein